MYTYTNSYTAHHHQPTNQPSRQKASKQQGRPSTPARPGPTGPGRRRREHARPGRNTISLIRQSKPAMLQAWSTIHLLSANRIPPWQYNDYVTDRPADRPIRTLRFRKTGVHMLAQLLAGTSCSKEMVVHRASRDKRAYGPKKGSTDFPYTSSSASTFTIMVSISKW